MHARARKQMCEAPCLSMFEAILASELDRSGPINFEAAHLFFFAELTYRSSQAGAILKLAENLMQLAVFSFVHQILSLIHI